MGQLTYHRYVNRLHYSLFLSKFCFPPKICFQLIKALRTYLTYFNGGYTFIRISLGQYYSFTVTFTIYLPTNDIQDQKSFLIVWKRIRLWYDEDINRSTNVKTILNQKPCNVENFYAKQVGTKEFQAKNILTSSEAELGG